MSVEKWFYDGAREAFVGGDLDWDAGDFRVILLSAAYAPDRSGHVFLTSVAGAARVATSASLSGKTKTAGVLDANDVTMSSVSGDPVVALVIYQHTGVEGTSRLVLYTNQVAFTPDGGNVTVRWSDGPNRIGKL